MRPMRHLPWSPVVLLASTLAAQVPGPAAGPTDKALQLARDDLQKVAASLAGPHTFLGEATFAIARSRSLDPVTLPFRGAYDGRTDQFWCQEFHVLTDRKVELHKKGDGPFTEPQGDAPDCPLSPRDLSALLPQATVDAAEATSHADRPAMQAHVTWPHQVAAYVVESTAFPGARQQALIDAVENAMRRGHSQFVVDANIVYDPATRVMLAATVRLASLDPKTAAEEGAAKHPRGLPKLANAAHFTFEFHVDVQAPAMVQLPELTDAQRKALGLPALAK